MDDILHDISSSAVPQAMDANVIAFWTLFNYLPQVHLHDEHGIRWFESGIHHDVFNRVLQMRLETSTSSSEIGRVSHSFQQRRIPFLWQIGPSSFPNKPASLLQSHGLIHHETEPTMAVDLQTFNEENTVSSQLDIQLVTTKEQLQQWIRVWEYESTEEVIRLWFTFYSGLHFDAQSPLRLFLGIFDGKPVATSKVFFHAGVASIGTVSTLPHQRRQGIGAAMTLMALREARKQGYRIGVLTASPMGITLYRRIGFQENGFYSTYLWHPPYNAKSN